MTDRCDIIAKFWKELDDSPFVMLGIPAQGAHSVPMTAQFDDAYPNQIFFFTTKDNRLAENLGQGGVEAMAQFASKGHDFFACLRGRLTPIKDHDVRDKFWSKEIDAWFEGGKTDPHLEVLKFDLIDAEMWLADMNVAGLFKMIFGGEIDKDDARDKHIETAM
jgi:general stress protein 26